MCRQCEECANCKFHKGAVRGIMDADPDEYWCDAGEDEYFYAEDEEIIKDLRNAYVEELVSQGVDREKAEELAEEEEFEVDCPSCSYYDPYEDYYDDGPYDTDKEKYGDA